MSIKKLALGVVAVVVIAVGIFIAIQPRGFRLITSPSKTHPIDAPLVFVYSEPIVTPDDIATLIQVDPAILGEVQNYGDGYGFVFSPYRTFKSETTYTVSVSEIQSVDGAVIEPYTFEITPQYIALGDQPEHLQELAILTSDAEENDPVIGKLPYETDTFRVETLYNTNIEEQELVVTTFATYNPNGSFASYRTLTKQYQGDAVQWIRDQGVDPQDYSIRYEPEL